MQVWVDANGWPVPPAILLGCLLLELVYFRGWNLITRRIQVQEASRAAHPSTLPGPTRRHDSWHTWLWRGICFSCALLLMLVAVSTPLDVFAGRLFWVHMIQHLLLLVVVPPLLVASAPLLPLWLGLPRWSLRLVKRGVRLPVRKTLYRAGSWLCQPPIACVLFVVGIWLWHWPPLYDLALTNGAIHDWLEHTTFLAVSVLFWVQIIPSPPVHRHAGHLGRLGCIGVAIVQNVVLAAILGFASHPLYAPYAHAGTGPGGLTALQDQSLGAGIMWTVGDLPFGIAFSLLLHQWLTLQLGSEEEVQLSKMGSAHTSKTG